MIWSRSHIVAYIEELGSEIVNPSVKQQLAAIRPNGSIISWHEAS
jgi:hypothetical protein